MDLFTSPALNVSACKRRCAGKNCGSLFSLLQLRFCFEPVSTSHLAGKEIHYGPHSLGSLILYSRGDAGVLALALSERLTLWLRRPLEELVSLRLILSGITAVYHCGKGF